MGANTAASADEVLTGAELADFPRAIIETINLKLQRPLTDAVTDPDFPPITTSRLRPTLLNGNSLRAIHVITI